MANPVVHFEIGCRDLKKSQAFYEQVFGWSTSPYGPAIALDTLSSEGIKGFLNSLGHEPHNYTIVYVQVDDIDAVLKDIEHHGGKMMVPKIEVPGQGWFSWITDPEGTIVGLWTPA